ncbi:MAG: homocysteine S-methyltransferase family protein [Dehalococcoidia bacterium]|nr:homocysteine S-methyltransferase family protein [Dehalococcoidia bacterium]
MYVPLDHPFLNRLRERVLFAAGPIGSTILSLRPGPDYGGIDGCNEYLAVSDPDVLTKIQHDLYAAGCDAVDSATFGANEVVFAEYDLVPRVREINRLAAQQLNAVRDAFSTPEWPRYSFGTIGPGTKLPSLGHITWDELVQSYYEQAMGLLEGGIDVMKVETCQDLLQTKAALAGIAAVFAETGRRIPVIASVTIETTGTMLLGSDIACALTALEALDLVDVIGINCATGPEQMVEHVRYLAEHSRRPVFIGPNAGLPELVGGEACYPLSPEEFARYQRIFVDEFGTNIAAGCCGTTPAHFAAARAAIGDRPPKAVPARARFLSISPLPPGEGQRVRADAPPADSGPGTKDSSEAAVSSLYTSVPIEQDTSFLVVGERMNATGSKAFRDLLLAGDLDGMVALAKEQTAEGAHVLDVMVDYVGRDGVPDMEALVSVLRTQSTLPLVFDSTEVRVVEAALKLYGGKALVNSINLEDGERKISQLLPIIRRHGAAAVALLIDETGQARDFEWKMRVAERIYDIAVNRFGLEPGDLLFDTLTFPLSSGQEDLRGDAMESLRAIRAIKERFPGVHTILGVSNVSFGLRPPARRVLNSVFLHEAVEHGLDAAIVNAKQILPLNRIPEEQLQTARDLIYDRRREGYDPLTHFIGLFEGVEAEKTAAKADRSAMPVEERLKQRIVDGDRRGIEADLDEALGAMDALTIINAHLLEGMRVVGELFGAGKMQLPFVLQSAETMKTAVGYLEPHMDKVDGAGKGTIVLATVRGDVHDIGKNLVDIILSNNGYTTHNLGIKQPIQNVIDRATEVNADAIGLSGLLVKSTVVMREDLEELNARELFHFPVLLGGAALTRKYVEQDLRGIYKGEVYYCQDAFEGLATLDRVMSREAVGAAAGARDAAAGGGAPPDEDAPYERVHVDPDALPAAVLEYAVSDVRSGPQPDVPKPPFWGSRVVRGLPLRDIFPFVNETALFRGQWQYQKGQRSDGEYAAFVESEVRPVFRRWQERAIAEQLLVPQVVYGYFPCQADGNDLVVWPGYDGGPVGEPVRFTFPRQSGGRRLCIADFYRAKGEAPGVEQHFGGADGGPYDVLGLSLVTMGPKATPFAQELFAANEYRDYLHFHGFAVESTEGLAEMWHRRIREELGIAGDDAKTMKELFAQGYRGSRYAFGYPACPDLEQQTLQAKLLDPARIGVELGETFQWHPEQSTSALVTHHPAARYFVVR